MKKETRTVVYDDELRIEAYRFEGIIQPFPGHFQPGQGICHRERQHRAFQSG